MLLPKKFVFIALLLVIIAAVGANPAAAESLRLIIGGKTIHTASPVISNQTVYIPTDTAKHLGAICLKSGSRSGDDQILNIIMNDGRKFTCNGQYFNNELMFPISDIAYEAGFIINQDVNANSINVLAIIQRIDLDSSELKVTTSYPVTYKIDFWKAKNRLIVDINGAVFPEKSSNLTINNTSGVNIRFGKDGNNSHIVLDMPSKISFKTISASTSSIIAASISGLKYTSKADASPQIQTTDTSNTPSADVPNTIENAADILELPSLPPAAINDVNVINEGYGKIRVEIKSNSNLEYSSSMSRNPDRITVNISNAVIEREVNNSIANNNILKSLSAAQQYNNNVQIILDLKRIVSYTAIQNTRSNILNVTLELPKGAGGSISDKIVFIDPGHGGPTKVGAKGSNGVREKEITYSIALRVQSILSNQGVCAFLTRNGDVELDKDLSADLRKRVDIAARNSADFFISIHCNAVSSSKKVSGVETYYHGGDPNGMALAYSIHPEIIKVTGAVDRKVKSDKSLYSSGLSVLRNSSEKYNIPAILIETGFIDHPGECGLLCDPQYQRKIAEAIVRGLKNYIEGSSSADTSNTNKKVKTNASNNKTNRSKAGSTALADVSNDKKMSVSTPLKPGGNVK